MNDKEYSKKKFEEITKYLGGREEKKKQFPPLTIEELTEILGMTIKKDDRNKILTFLCCLSAYTEDSQFNISFNAPSSSGKSYIPLEIASLFPAEDVVELGYCTPQAFFHDIGKYNKTTNTHTIDFERKIIIFLDQPYPEVLHRLRPLLSHDKKEITAKITDKSAKGGMQTKNVAIKGFPSVIFCSVGLITDDQEATRFLLLSPETTQDKLKAGILESLCKETDKVKYFAALNSELKRQQLIERIKAIRDAHINEIKIHDPAQIEKWFFEKYKMFKPRHQRDMKRVITIIKSLALLNLWHRNTENLNQILTNNEDIRMGIEIWESISEAQEFNLSPYILLIFKEVIVPVYTRRQCPVTAKEILQEHFKVYGRMLDKKKLFKEIMPMLETAGLISIDKDPHDKRTYLFKVESTPTPLSTISYEGNIEDSGVEWKVNPPDLDSPYDDSEDDYSQGNM